MFETIRKYNENSSVNADFMAFINHANAERKKQAEANDKKQAKNKKKN